MIVSDQPTETPEPNRWMLTAAEMNDLLESIKTGSLPVRSDEADDLQKALRRVARPEVVLGLLHYPPETPDVTWFYGLTGDKHFAAHRQDDKNGQHHIIWPVFGKTLLKLIETVLTIDQPAVTDGFSLSGNRAAFETLALIVDIVQEEALIGALNREVPKQPEFSVDDLFECHKRSLEGIDLRWMVQRAKLLSPIHLSADIEDLKDGIDYLASEGMLTEKGKIYTPTDRFNTACSLLGACTGFCALSTRLRTPHPEDENRWDLQHVAALRGMGSLWVFEFTNVTSTDFTVKLGDISSGLLHERLLAGLLLSETGAEASTLPERPPVKKNVCRKCGVKLREGVKFCPKCGTPVGGD